MWQTVATDDDRRLRTRARASGGASLDVAGGGHAVFAVPAGRGLLALGGGAVVLGELDVALGADSDL